MWETVTVILTVLSVTTGGGYSASGKGDCAGCRACGTVSCGGPGGGEYMLGLIT